MTRIIIQGINGLVSHYRVVLKFLILIFFRVHFIILY